MLGAGATNQSIYVLALKVMLAGGGQVYNPQLVPVPCHIITLMSELCEEKVHILPCVLRSSLYLSFYMSVATHSSFHSVLPSNFNSHGCVFLYKSVFIFAICWCTLQSCHGNGAENSFPYQVIPAWSVTFRSTCQQPEMWSRFVMANPYTMLNSFLYL